MAFDPKGNVAGQLQQMFPTLYNATKGIPELWNILIWGATAGWDATLVESAIQNSNYYKKSSDAKRQWDVLAATNPAEAVARQKKAQNDVLLASMRMGANLSLQQIGLISQGVIEEGWSTAQFNDVVLGYAAGLPEAKRSPGEFGGTMTKVRQIADDYAMPVTDREATSMAQRLLQSGSRGDEPGANEAAIRDIFAKRAESLFPSLKGELSAGVTVKQWASPYMALAAKELELSPDAIKLSDPKWRRMLEGTKNDKTGAVAPMTLSEWQARIRNGAQYGFDKTTGARDQAAQMETELMKRFGGI